MMVSGASEPTSISVVLKFSNDIKNEIAAAPIRAGLSAGNVMVINTATLGRTQVVSRLLEGDVKTFETRRDDQRGNRHDVRKLSQHHQRQAGT